ncbi:hypothetical protein BKA67DRAFT_255627 [Truncatella angustata]|uniref:Uncharacterized protein n=1 Tax=Truncatella angustata TaxID=152316 RepID=A0A9P8UQ77_9PEZI|nr:uncharacterized protein BKA67DRAFT_255627 [Truncatella angustata]KAH6656111.1 hypothetical protein BKA67DRAFT_255627 [Truncatella angustata]KAH8202387.1 hypothetical protein TruAng_003460 [Truncatella angustata]
MVFSRLASLVAIAGIVQACEQCVHPGNFTGTVAWYNNFTNICLGSVPTIAAATPHHFWDPRDEAPCGMKITVINPYTGQQVVATIAGQDTTLAGDNLLLNTAGLAALAPDANPNHVPGYVNWTFNG